MRLARVMKAMVPLALVLGTAGCGGAEEPAAPAAPEAPEGVTVSGAWLSLPAVAGNPGAVYFTIANSSENPVMIRTAHVAGAASAMIHETATWSHQTDMQELFQVPLPAGGEVEFAPGGKHVMAMELDDTLAVGGTTEVTLSFTGGDKISFPAEIRAPGDAPGD